MGFGRSLTEILVAAYILLKVWLGEDLKIHTNESQDSDCLDYLNNGPGH